MNDLAGKIEKGTVDSLAEGSTPPTERQCC